jgi:YARHG domain
MRLILAGLTALIAVVSIDATITSAKAQTCQSLWVERNSYYKRHGYCFKTRRAIAYFGNAGCYINYEGNVPLSRAERIRIARIRALERALGCN